MRFLLAILVPPLAILLCGKPLQSMINACLYVPGVIFCWTGIGLLPWLIAAVHALMVVNNSKADKRQKQLIAAVKAGRV